MKSVCGNAAQVPAPPVAGGDCIQNQSPTVRTVVVSMNLVNRHFEAASDSIQPVVIFPSRPFRALHAFVSLPVLVSALNEVTHVKNPLEASHSPAAGVFRDLATGERVDGVDQAGVVALRLCKQRRRFLRIRCVMGVVSGCASTVCSLRDCSLRDCGKPSQ
jgi:hypothetical protein